MFNILTDDLPESVVIDGITYEINYTAKNMIEISSLIEDTHLPKDDQESHIELAMKQLELFYPVIPENKQAGMQKLIEFYTCSLDEYKKQKSQGSNGIEEKQSYSFKYDSSLIFSAFMQQYNINSIKNLHWYEFKSMLNGLTEECLFVKVTQWRALKLSSKMSKDEKAFYRKMKRVYALPDNRTEEQKEAEFSSAIFGL